MKAQLLSAAAVSAILVTAAGVSAASAQVMDPQTQRNVGVMDRPRPDYDAAGMRSGAFIILPRLTTTVDFDDNIYAGSTTKTSDTVVLLQPEVTVRSDDDTHFEAVVVAPQFVGKRPLARHQVVYATLGEAVGREIHALSIQAHTPEEWAARSGA